VERKVPPVSPAPDEKVTFPSLKINMIRLSTPEKPKSVAVVNMHIVQEGNMIAETGVQVIKISKNEVLFEYKGQHFPVPFR
jgi:type II secretory pathway component PulC